MATTFTNFFKRPGDPTVFGIAPGGQRVAFENPEQFFSSGGARDFSNVREDPTFNPAGFVKFSQFASAAPTSGVSTSTEIRKQEEQKKLDQQKSDIEKEREIQRLDQEARRKQLETVLAIPTPSRPDLAGEFTAIREQQGIAGIEAELTDLDRQILDLQAEAREGSSRIREDQAIPTGIIGGQEREFLRGKQEEIDALNRQRAITASIYQTKQNLVSSIMSFKQTDYSNAVSEYNIKFNQAVTLVNMVNDYENTQIARENRLADDARANLSVISSIVKDSGKTWTEIDDGMRAQINKLELQSGLPVGSIGMFINEFPKSQLLTSVTGTDASGNDIVSFIYKDENGRPGIVEVVKTGGFTKPSTKKTTTNGSETVFTDESGNEITPFESAEKFAEENSGLSEAELKKELRKKYGKNLSDGDINSIAVSAIEKRPVDPDEFSNQLISAIKTMKDRGVTRDIAKKSLLDKYEGKIGEDLIDQTLDAVYGNNPGLIKQVVKDIGQAYKNIFSIFK